MSLLLFRMLQYGYVDDTSELSVIEQLLSKMRLAVLDSNTNVGRLLDFGGKTFGGRFELPEFFANTKLPLRNKQDGKSHWTLQSMITKTGLRITDASGNDDYHHYEICCLQHQGHSNAKTTPISNITRYGYQTITWGMRELILKHTQRQHWCMMPITLGFTPPQPFFETPKNTFHKKRKPVPLQPQSVASPTQTPSPNTQPYNSAAHDGIYSQSAAQAMKPRSPFS